MCIRDSVHYAGALLRFPFDYDQGEGFELYDTVLHARGEWPYADSQVFPYYTSIYPPLFHLLTAPLVPFFMIIIGKSGEALIGQQFASLRRLSAHFYDVLQGLTTL